MNSWCPSSRNTENITFTQRTGTGPWATVQKEYFGPYVAFTVSITEMNNDGKEIIREVTDLQKVDSMDAQYRTVFEYYLKKDVYDNIYKISVFKNKSYSISE